MEKTKIVNYPTKKNFKKAMVATALGLSLAMGTTSVPVLNNVATVEAASKKDRKKPKIKFSGKKQLEVTEGEKITIPKTTYSDNQTKKKKLKVGVTVKKGNKNYKSIANKIKTATVKNKPVDVVFEEEGKYKITTTVTDLSKNKATAVRYVTVNDKEEITTEEIVTKVDPEPIVTPTPEEPARTVTTETPVTEEPKKEEPNGKKTLNYDLSKYGNIKKVIINGIEYKVIENKQITDYEFDNDAEYEVSGISKDTYSEYNAIIGSNSSLVNEKYLPLYFLGKISAKKGDYDYSQNVFVTIYDVDTKYEQVEADILYENEENKLICISCNRFYKGNYEDLIESFDSLFPSANMNTTYYYDDENEFRITPSPISDEYKMSEKTLKLVPQIREQK